MIRYMFGPEDLGRVRFAISPLFELAASVEVLRDPGPHGLHAPWARSARRRLGGLDIALLEALLPERGYRPDFITPPPGSPRAELASELARVRATPAAQIRKELAWAFPDGRLPAPAQALLDAPDAGLERLTAQMAAYWQIAIAPVWGRLVAALASQPGKPPARQRHFESNDRRPGQSTTRPTHASEPTKPLTDAALKGAGWAAARQRRSVPPEAAATCVDGDSRRQRRSERRSAAPTGVAVGPAP